MVEILLRILIIDFREFWTDSFYFGHGNILPGGQKNNVTRTFCSKSVKKTLEKVEFCTISKFDL